MSAHSWVARTPCRNTAPDSGLLDSSLRLHALSQPVDCGLNAARTVRNAERLEAHLDDAECSQHHGSVDVPHMGNAESLARHFPNPRPENDAALGIAVIPQWTGIMSVGHENRGHRIGALG